MSHLSGTLVISLFAARNLPPMNSNGKCDAFVQFQCGPNKLKSKVVKSLNPVFNERFSFKYEPKHGHISLGLYDEGFMSNTLIGETFIDVSGFVNISRREWFPLVTRCGKPPGELDMEITFQCPGAPPSQHPAPAPAAQSQPPVAPPPAPAPAAPAPAPAPAAPAPMPTPIVAQTVVTSPTPVVATYVVPQPQPQPRPSAAQVTPCGTIVPQQIGGPAPQQPMMVMPMQQPPMSMQQPPMPMQQPSMPMQQPPMQMGMATTPMQMGVNVGMPGGMGMGMSVAQPGMMGMPSMGMQVGMQQPMGMMGGFQPTGMMDPSMGGMAVGMSAQPSVSVNFGMPSQQGMMPQQGFQGGYGYGY